MKIYVVIESGNICSEEGNIVLGATRYKNDAIKYAAERNDYNEMNHIDCDCDVKEFESESINTESKIMPFIKYSIIFNSDGELVLINSWNYTYNECFDVHYKKLYLQDKHTECYVMNITLDFNVPENTVKEIAKNRMEEWLCRKNFEVQN